MLPCRRWIFDVQSPPCWSIFASGSRAIQLGTQSGCLYPRRVPLLNRHRHLSHLCCCLKNVDKVDTATRVRVVVVCLCVERMVVLMTLGIPWLTHPAWRCVWGRILDVPNPCTQDSQGLFSHAHSCGALSEGDSLGTTALRTDTIWAEMSRELSLPPLPLDMGTPSTPPHGQLAPCSEKLGLGNSAGLA